ncbi:MAG: shikimate kinase [Ruminococcaceae bacterium]|nr:shikimate kinase [Oscillospiraceae bacterium]
MWSKIKVKTANNIILIGMPGSGKSTCGVLAAKALCMRFVDTDLVLQQQLRMPLQQILNKKGKAFFEQEEEKWLCAVVCNDTVIATGGSAVNYEKAMRHLAQIGTVVYLKISYEEMCARIKNITTRGIVLEEGETLESMYHKREALYERYAERIIDCEKLTAEEVVAELCK